MENFIYQDTDRDFRTRKKRVNSYHLLKQQVLCFWLCKYVSHFQSHNSLNYHQIYQIISKQEQERECIV